jgi:peptide chain release factor subunit 1
VHLDALRGQGEVVPLDAVGGSMLLVRADRHRDGLVFPCWPYGEASARCRPEAAELETEGLGLLAHDMGVGAFGMPDLEVVHKRA